MVFTKAEKGFLNQGRYATGGRQTAHLMRILEHLLEIGQLRAHRDLEHAGLLTVVILHFEIF